MDPYAARGVGPTRVQVGTARTSHLTCRHYTKAHPGGREGSVVLEDSWRGSGITGLCHVAMVSIFMYIYMLSVYRGGGGIPRTHLYIPV